MRRLLTVFLLTLAAFTADAACTGKLSVRATPANPALAATFETDKAPPIKKEDEVTLTIGDTELDATVKSVSPLLGTTIIDLGVPEGAEFENGVLKVKADISTSEAKLTYKESGTEKSVDLCLVGQFNSSDTTFNVGLASESNEDENDASGAAAVTEDDPDASAVRIQYSSSARRFTVADKANLTDIPSARLSVTEFAVAIDTTNKKDEKFVDDNRARAGYFSPRRSFGQAVNRIRWGVNGEHARAFHGGNNNSDLTLSVDGWLPMFRAINIATPVRRLALPLNFKISAGNRWQDVDDVSSEGPVAHWAFLYHVYLLSDYRVDLEHKTVFNDVSNRPASTPRTQHTWKASLLMFADDESRFSAVASYESGHSGPIFTQLRQYFVGVGIKNLLAKGK